MFKPPLVTFILLLILTIVMFFLGIGLTVTITGPLTNLPSGNPNQSVSTQSVMQTSLSTILLLGSVFSFVGVAIAELASRVRKRMMF